MNHNLCRAEKKITVVKDEHIHKMTIIFTPNCQALSFWVKMVVIFWIFSTLKIVIFFSAFDKLLNSSANSSKFKQMEWATDSFAVNRTLEEMKELSKSKEQSLYDGMNKKLVSLENLYYENNFKIPIMM